MSLSRVEIASLTVATVAAGSAIWQGILTRDAINAQSKSNLQARQVDVCANLLSVVPEFHWHFLHVDEWKGTFDEGMNLGVWTSRKSPEGSTDGETLPQDPAEASMERLLISAQNALRRVDDAVSDLYPFASEETQKQVTEVKAAALSMLIREEESVQTNESTRVQLVSTIDELSRKCRAVMVGEDLGMI